MLIEDKRTTKNIVIRSSRALLAFLRWGTCGEIDLRYEARTTTIGKTIFTGTNWETKSEREQAVEMAHEQVHVEQWQNWGPLYYLSYVANIWTLIFPVLAAIMGAPWWAGALLAIFGTILPAGLSIRAYWEYKAFCATIKAWQAAGVRFTRLEQAADRYADYLHGKSYYYAAALVPRYVLRRAFERVLLREAG